MRQISVVIYSWNQNYNHRLYHLLVTLAKYQSTLPYEIIIVDNSNDETTGDTLIDDISRFRSEFKSPTHIRLLLENKVDIPYKAWGLNYGIKKTSEDSDFILTTDIDMVFPPDWIESALQLMDENTFMLNEPSKLPGSFNSSLESIDWEQADWGDLFKRSAPWGKAKGPGNGQIFPREWVMKVHGYNEIFKEGQDGLDMDMFRRAHRDGLNVIWRYRNDNKFLHLDHPISKWKGKNHKFMNVQYKKRVPDVVVNLDGWGEERQ